MGSLQPRKPSLPADCVYRNEISQTRSSSLSPVCLQETIVKLSMNMAAGNRKKQEKMKQKDYLNMIASSNDVEKWLVNVNNNDRSKSPEKYASGTKRDNFKIREKDYLEFVDIQDLDRKQLTTDKKHSDSSDLAKPIKEDKKKNRRPKVKQGDLMNAINEASRAQKTASREKGQRKKHTKYVISDEDEFMNPLQPRKIVFQAHDGGDIQKKPIFEVKRYHSPREVSEILQSCSSPKSFRKKKERSPLEEENPLDFGSLIVERISSMKTRSSSSSSGVRKKIFNGSSKKYNVSKEQKGITKEENIPVSQPQTPQKKHIEEEQEIFISLDRKSPREKNDLINETMPNIFNPSVENDSLSERKFSIDGRPRNLMSSGKASLGFSDLHSQDEMLF